MKYVASFVLCAAIIAAGAGVVYQYTMQAANTDLEKKPPDAPKHTNVRVQTLKPVDLDDVLVLTGRIDPWESVAISSETAGNIEWKGIEEGQSVNAGQELIKVDTSTLKLLYEQTEARRALTQQELSRSKSLRKDGIGSPQDLDYATMESAVADADLNVAKLRLDKSVVKAPIDGIVNKLYVDAGEFVDTGKPLLEIVQVRKVKAKVGIPERDIVHFSLGDKVSIILDALPDRRFEGAIYRIAASSDLTTRTFNTEIELDNADGTLKPGMTIRARMVRGTFPAAIVVPIFAVMSLENQRFAVIEENGAARVRPIEVGILQGNQVQVTKGLTAGERLIVVGQRDLRDGDLVTVTAEVDG